MTPEEIDAYRQDVKDAEEELKTCRTLVAIMDALPNPPPDPNFIGYAPAGMRPDPCGDFEDLVHRRKQRLESVLDMQRLGEASDERRRAWEAANPPPPAEPGDPLDAQLPPMPTTRVGLSAAQIRKAMRSVLPFCSTNKMAAFRQEMVDQGNDEWTMAVVDQEIERELKGRR